MKINLKMYFNTNNLFTNAFHRRFVDLKLDFRGFCFDFVIFFFVILILMFYVEIHKTLDEFLLLPVNVT